jgi:pimeloyl-ACP methyl ester carboxylesterase
MNSPVPAKSGFSKLKDLDLYYEIYGEGEPLVLIHGGGSTIWTSFGRLIPLLSGHRSIIAVELQAHGRTADRQSPLSFEQDADDICMLLDNLDIARADYLGFSNGGQTAIEIALRHPHRVRKIIIASSFYNRAAVAEDFWKGFDDATLDQMPQPLHEGFLAVNNNRDALQTMFNRDVERMKNFKGWTDNQLQSIRVPVLVMNGSHDLAAPEHAVEMFRLIPGAELAILPGIHGSYLGTIETIGSGEWKNSSAAGIINEFLG